MRPIVVACVVFLVVWAAILLVPSAADQDARALAYFSADFLRDTEDLTWRLHVVSGMRAVGQLVFFWVLLLSPLGQRWQQFWARRSIVVEAAVVVIVVQAGLIALRISQLVVVDTIRAASVTDGRPWSDSLWTALSTATASWHRGIFTGLITLILLRRLPRAWPVVFAFVFIGGRFVVSLTDEASGVPLSSMPPPLDDRTAPLLELVRSAGVSPDVVFLEDDPDPLGQSGFNFGVGSRTGIGLHAGFARTAAFPVVAKTLAHEVGHFVARDQDLDILAGVIVLLATLLLKTWALRRARVLGARPTVVWPLFVLVSIAADAAGELAKNPFDAWQERRADAVAVELVGSDAAMATAIFSATRRRFDPTRSFWQMLRRPYPSDLQRIELAKAQSGPTVRGILLQTVP